MTCTARDDLGAWLDLPPGLALASKHLTSFRALPLSHVAVMGDGPAVGLDARWGARDLERLAKALPDHRRTLTVWLGARRGAKAELERELPRLLDALGADALEVDVEPAGQWSEKGVRGYVDVDGDGRRLDEASDDLAPVLLASGRDVEVTVFPSALVNVLPLLRALLARRQSGQRVRLLLQVYPVVERSGKRITWNAPLGPVRYPAESLRKALDRVPVGVELCVGLAAYRQTGFVDHVDERARAGGTITRSAQEAMVAAYLSVREVPEVRLVRWWSARHIESHGYAQDALETLRPYSLRA